MIRQPGAPVEPLPEGTTYDYTTRRWGHDYSIWTVVDGGRELFAAGWGPITGQCLQPGDYLILRGRKPGTSTRYRVAEVRYERDPKDMWWATLRFAPRPVAAGER